LLKATRLFFGASSIQHNAHLRFAHDSLRNQAKPGRFKVVSRSLEGRLFVIFPKGFVDTLFAGGRIRIKLLQATIEQLGEGCFAKCGAWLAARSLELTFKLAFPP
jgi:hypothetical protein